MLILVISDLFWFRFSFWAQVCSAVSGIAKQRTVEVVVSFVLWKQPMLSWTVEDSLEGPEPSLRSSLFGSHTLCHSEPRLYIHPAMVTPPLLEWVHLKSPQDFLVQASQRYLHLFQSQRFYRSIETSEYWTCQKEFLFHNHLHHLLVLVCFSQSLILFSQISFPKEQYVRTIYLLYVRNSLIK